MLTVSTYKYLDVILDEFLHLMMKSKTLANSFGLFFIDKIKKIRDTFKHTPSKSSHPDKEPPTFSSF